MNHGMTQVRSKFAVLAAVVLMCGAWLPVGLAGAGPNETTDPLVVEGENALSTSRVYYYLCGNESVSSGVQNQWEINCGYNTGDITSVTWWRNDDVSGSGYWYQWYSCADSIECSLTFYSSSGTFAAVQAVVTDGTGTYYPDMYINVN
jgi:hypothetical protein